MFQTQAILALSVCVLLFMHPLVELKLSPTNTNSKNRTRRAVSRISEENLWDDGIILYRMESDLEPHRCLIESAMMHIMLKSCVAFLPVYDEEIRAFVPVLEIVKSDKKKCAASMGVTWFEFLGGGILALDYDKCYNFGVILHELMHVLGFDHEHQRSDRDQYLQVNYDNLKNSSSIPHFDKKNTTGENILTEFDIDSITIYGPVAGSNRQTLKTVESKISGKKTVAPEDKLGLSPLDVKAINALYKCSLMDNRACKKLTLLDNYITNCSAVAPKYIKLTLIKQLIDQCK